MADSILHLPSFRIIGLAVRTTNQGAKSQEDISGLWQRFMREDIISKIPDKENDQIYCLYTDYENEANGHYTTIIGCKVKSLEKTPEFCIGKTIPASTYQLIVSKGKLPEAVVDTWKRIWLSGMKRKFQTDFDLYGEKSKDPNRAEVETYLSVP
ncbi:MAG: GyrI-like domain-containing protein [Chitinophagales bacterium]